MRSEPALNPNNHAPAQIDCQTISSSPRRYRVSADRACRARSVSPVAKPWVSGRAIDRGPVGAVHRGRAEDVFARWAKANHAGVVEGDGIGERPLQGRGVFGDANPGLCPGLGEAALQAACRWVSIRNGKASPLSRETGCEQQRSLNRGGGAGVGEQRVVVISVAGRSPRGARNLEYGASAVFPCGQNPPSIQTITLPHKSTVKPSAAAPGDIESPRTEPVGLVQSAQWRSPGFRAAQ